MNTREYLNTVIEEHFDGELSFPERKAKLLNRVRAEIQYHAGEAREASLLSSDRWYNYHHRHVRRLKKWEKVLMKM